MYLDFMILCVRYRALCRAPCSLMADRIHDVTVTSSPWRKRSQNFSCFKVLNFTRGCDRKWISLCNVCRDRNV